MTLAMQKVIALPFVLSVLKSDAAEDVLEGVIAGEVHAAAQAEAVFLDRFGLQQEHAGNLFGLHAQPDVGGKPEVAF